MKVPARIIGFALLLGCYSSAHAVEACHVGRLCAATAPVIGCKPLPVLVETAGKMMSEPNASGAGAMRALLAMSKLSYDECKTFPRGKLVKMIGLSPVHASFDEDGVQYFTLDPHFGL